MRDEKQAMLAGVQNNFAAFCANDLDGVMDLYTRDGEYMPYGGSRIVGYDALYAYYKDFMDKYKATLETRIEDADCYGNWGVALGLYRIVYKPHDSDNEPIIRGGRFFVQMSCEAGVWKFKREITQETSDTF